MICNERASASQIEALDKEIAAFGKRQSSFGRGDSPPPPVMADDEVMVAKIEREVAAVHKVADDLLVKITGMLNDARGHKQHHLIEWARRGCPPGEEDEDYIGIELGNVLESSLDVRKQAVEAVRSRLLSKVPLIEAPVHEHNGDEVDDAALLAMAKQMWAQQKKG